MMTRLEMWLRNATRRLSKDSTAQVRSEIGEHYESARDAALGRGASPEEADRIAMAALGDARMANGQYRKVLLTVAEARMLRTSNQEARALCSGGLLKGLLIAVSVGLLCGAAVFFFALADGMALNLLLGGMMVGLLSTAPFLPIYTPSRGRVFRGLKYVLLVATLGLGFHWSWLFISCLWPLAWVEWTRASIRRKLPVAQWPRQLYL
jgi:hypothetical protein